MEQLRAHWELFCRAWNTWSVNFDRDFFTLLLGTGGGGLSGLARGDVLGT